MKQIITAILALITVLFTACGPAIEGNGNITKKEFDVKPFKNIQISGLFDVVLRQGNKEELSIETDENLLNHIIVEFLDKTLKINAKERLTSENGVKIFISCKNIENIDLDGAIELSSKGILKSKKIAIDGSGAVDLDLDLDSKNVSIDMSGACEITLKGNCNNLSVDMSGAGELNSLDLLSENVSVSVSGAGNAQINAKSELKVDVSGAGSVEYIGDPIIDQHISGAGSVKKKSNY